MRCTASQFEEMKNSPFWLDVLDFIQEQKQQLAIELCRTSWNHSSGELDMDFNTRLMHDENLRGAVRQLEILENATEYLRDLAEVEQEERQKDQKEE